MRQIKMITLLAALCLVNWAADDAFAAERTTSEKREISTNSEHYWVVTIDGREQKDGVYTRLAGNGQKIEEGSYALGKKDGQWLYWSKDGRKTKEEHYAGGKKHGVWAQWYANGQKESEGGYELDVPVNTHRQWHKDGAVKSETVYQKKGKDVTALKKTWHPDGKPYAEYELANGKMHGRYISWYPNGQTQAQYAYDQGQRHGKYLEWYPDGQPKADFTYDHGRKTGQSTEWYANGQVSASGVYAEGKEGVWTTWEKSGQIRSQTKYKAGVVVKE
jgi:antitoxin component YwqK of YwqJK toxin-antitoxin module